MAIVYQHRRLDTKEIFYIGIELDSLKRKAKGKRSKNKYNRSQFWKNIVNHTKYEVEILFNDIDNITAKQIEEYLIRYYGRRDLELGPLVNLTFGGDGAPGHVQSPEHREKIRNSMKGKNIGINNPMYGKNPYEGKIHYSSIEIINTETLDIYPTIKSVLDIIKIPKTTFLRWLNNDNLNKSVYKYYNKININK